MEKINGEWIVYDTQGDTEDENGCYIKRVGNLKNFVHNNFIRNEYGYIPIVFTVNNKAVNQYLNELEYDKYFRNAKITIGVNHGIGSLA
jgi:hypothetical protein